MFNIQHKKSSMEAFTSFEKKIAQTCNISKLENLTNFYYLSYLGSTLENGGGVTYIWLFSTRRLPVTQQQGLSTQWGQSCCDFECKYLTNCLLYKFPSCYYIKSKAKLSLPTFLHEVKTGIKHTTKLNTLEMRHMVKFFVEFIHKCLMGLLLQMIQLTFFQVMCEILWPLWGPFSIKFPI